jgi:cytochrome P450
VEREVQPKMPHAAAAEIALPSLRFRPPAPEPLERDPGLRMLFDPRMARNPLTALPREAFERPYRRMRVLHLTYHGLNDPDAIKRVLLDNAANYSRPWLVRRIMRRMIGEGLLNAEGEAWRGQRRLMASAFAPAAVAAAAPLLARVADRSCARIRTDAAVDMAAEATRTTLDVIDGALFSGASGMAFEDAAGDVRDLLAGEGELRLGQVFGLEALDWAPAQRRGRAARRRLRTRMAAMIRTRAAADSPPDDFITRLLQAFSAEHGQEDAQRLTLDNAMTFFVAGHETTANGLAWALYLLSRDKQAQAWAREEAMAAWRDGDPAAVPERLPYLKMVWDETLRLYPPVHRIDREALDDDVLCGEPVRKGDMVTIWPWVLHRHRTLWDRPDEFNPENFDPEGRAGMHRYQYLPFGAGPRICIGMAFAQAEALILLSRWLTAFAFEPVAGHDAWPRADIALRPATGVVLTAKRP